MEFGHNLAPSSPLIYSKHRVPPSVCIYLCHCTITLAVLRCSMKTRMDGAKVTPPFCSWACQDVMLLLDRLLKAGLHASALWAGF